MEAINQKKRDERQACKDLGLKTMKAYRKFKKTERRKAKEGTK